MKRINYKTVDSKRLRKVRPRDLQLGYVDGRTHEARRFRDLYSQIVIDLGGQDNTSEAQLQLVRRAASLGILCEQAEAAMVDGQDVDVASYITLGNAQRRILVSLGLKRQAKDITPTLHSYLDRKAKRTVEREASAGAR